ncbi:MAG TPA: hypothetical protein PKK59_09195 [Anaerolineaceae bacterium]|nr:hypothetical protein [Anaerolineaceae bacterium]
MRKGKLVFFGGFVLIALIAVTVYLIYGESTAGQAVVYSMFLVAGVWMLLRKRIIGGDKIKAATPSMRQPFGSSAVQMMQGQTVNAGDNVAKVRREKNFIVEENIDAIHWPAECAWCGGAVERCETIKMKNKFKEFGEVKAELKGIPYCQRCARNAKLTDRVNTAVIILALVIGIPLTIFAKMGPTSGGAETPWWLTFVVCAGIGYGIAWLLFKLPYKLFFKKNLAEPVSAWLNEELKSDGQQGVCVRIDIPNKKFADRFAELNITGASFTMPVQEISDQAVVRVTGAVQEKPLLTSTELLNLPGVRALIECTRDDIMDTKAYWKQALEDLQARGEEGSRALAALIAEMLNCRTEKITSALAMVKNLVPTRELKESLNAVISAQPLKPVFYGGRFHPQIEGGGMIGWTDGAAARIRAAAAEALKALESAQPQQP